MNVELLKLLHVSINITLRTSCRGTRHLSNLKL